MQRDVREWISGEPPRLRVSAIIGVALGCRVFAEGRGRSRDSTVTSTERV